MAVQQERHPKTMMHQEGQIQYKVPTCVVSTAIFVTADKEKCQ